jgi:hypothetical protein
MLALSTEAIVRKTKEFVSESGKYADFPFADNRQVEIRQRL